MMYMLMRVCETCLADVCFGSEESLPGCDGQKPLLLREARAARKAHHFRHVTHLDGRAGAGCNLHSYIASCYIVCLYFAVNPHE